MPIDKQAAAAEALRRGLITPEQARQYGYGRAANAAATGQLAPSGPVGVDKSQDVAALNDLRAAAKDKRWQADQAKLFADTQYERGVGSGGIVGVPLVAEIMSAFNPDYAELNAITNRVAPTMRQVGSGSSSDTDVKMFKRSFPNLDNPGPANTAIARRLLNDAREAEAQAAFMDAWFAKNGTLLGATEAYTRSRRQPAAPPRKSKAAPASSAAPPSTGFRVIQVK